MTHLSGNVIKIPLLHLFKPHSGCISGMIFFVVHNVSTTWVFNLHYCGVSKHSSHFAPTLYAAVDVFVLAILVLPLVYMPKFLVNLVYVSKFEIYFYS